MTYTIQSSHYENYSVDVNGPFVIAFGVANAIHKQEKIDVDVTNSDGETVLSFRKS